MADPFIGEIKLFAFNFAPRGWAECDGQTLAIAQNQALFSLIGTRYGGNGATTFNLPDLRGRVAMHQGNGHTIGEAGGEAEVTLTLAHMPGDHSHEILATAEAANALSPTGAVLAKTTSPVYITPAAKTQPTTLSPAAVGPGEPASQPHENRQPYTVLRYCIALQGLWPTRN